MKKVHINMCPILDGYGVMTVFQFPYMLSCEPRLQLARSWTLLSSSIYLDSWPECGEGGGGFMTRAVHNRAAACVAAGGGIFENQL